MTRPQTTVLDGARRAPRIRSRRPVPRLREHRDRQRHVHRARDGRASRPGSRTRSRARRRARRPDRDAARQPGRAGRQLLRRAEARRGAGADQHRRTRASSCATSSPTPARRCSSCRATSRRVPSRSSATRRRPTLDALHHGRPARRGDRRGADDHVGRRARMRAPTRRSTRRGVRPSDLACFIYTAGTTGPSKGCMLPQNYIVSLADQIARAWERRSRRHRAHAAARCSTSTRSRCASSARCSSGGSAAIERRFSVSNFWPEVKRTGATMVSMLGSLAILIANADDHPDQQRPPAAAVRGRADAARHRRGVAASASAARRSAAGYGLTEASLISMLDAGEPNKPGAAGKPNLHEFDVRLVDDDDVEVAVGEVGEIVCRPNGSEPDVRRLLEPARRDRRGDPQPVVPHRRPRTHRRRRLHLLRRPQEGRAAPAGREHLELRDGEDAVRPRRAARRRGARGAERRSARTT